MFALNKKQTNKMKKLILVVMAVVAVGATSCKKCKDCTVTSKQDGVTVGTTDVGELCGDDLKEVDGKTISSTSMGITVEQTYNCD